MQVAFTPRGLPDVGPPPVPVKTLTRWNLFLGEIAIGTGLADAMLKHYMTRADIEACIRSDSSERTRWDEARTAALKRTWTVMQFEDIFERIAGGMPVTQAIEEVKGGGHFGTAFNKIVLADAVLNEQYLAALKARTLVMAEDVLEIADDATGDLARNDKGDVPNNAAVNRSKLRVETRMRLMNAWNTRMFGEGKNAVQVNVQVNHAQALEEARTRSTTRRPISVEPAIPQRVLEAAFSDVPAADDFSWLDKPAKEPAMDTVWLEET